MLVVADTTPINYLIQVDAAFVLPALFQAVLIPPIVEAELRHPRSLEAVQRFFEARPPWLLVEAPKSTRSIPSLDPGEEQAICLAESVHADAILMDELKGRSAARRAGLRVIGTVGVLELAAARGLIDLVAIADRLVRTEFHIHPSILRAAIGAGCRPPPPIAVPCTVCP